MTALDRIPPTIETTMSFQTLMLGSPKTAATPASTYACPAGSTRAGPGRASSPWKEPLSVESAFGQPAEAIAVRPFADRVPEEGDAPVTPPRGSQARA